MKIIILIIIIIFLKCINFDYFMFKSANKEKHKLVTSYDNFLDLKECNYLSDFLLNHKLNNKNKLSDIFDNSYGILIKFKDNLNHYKKFKKNNLLPIYQVFKKIKDPKCNAFVFNSLIINANSKNNKEIGIHYDNTLQIKNRGFFKKFLLPRWISIIYLKVPKNFKGGSLKVNNFRNHNFYCPKAKINPVTGKYIKMRGDSNHLVENIQSNEDSYRISIIFEQYTIDENINIPFSLN